MPIPPSITIRPLTPTDAPQIDRLQKLAYTPDLQEPLPSLVSKITVAPHFCFAAHPIQTTQPQPTPLAAYLLAHPWPADTSPGLARTLSALPPNADAMHLHDMAVDPAFAGQGIASALLNALVDTARSRGFTLITLVAVQGATSFWAKQGFSAQHPAAGYDDGAELMHFHIPPQHP